MKNQTLKLGDLDLQITFTFPDQNTQYRTITYPQRSGNKYWGTRECMDLSTNKAIKLECNKEIVPCET